METDSQKTGDRARREKSKGREAPGLPHVCLYKPVNQSAIYENFSQPWKLGHGNVGACWLGLQ